MKQLLSMNEKKAIGAMLDWPVDTDEESLKNYEDFLKCEWKLSDNPNDDDLVEAFDEGYCFPFKLLVDGSIYEALSTAVLDCIDKNKADKFKKSRYYHLYENLID